jgi:hypothetical protein
VLDRGIRTPETDLECAPGRLQVGRADWAEGQRLTRGVGEVVEAAEPVIKTLDISDQDRAAVDRYDGAGAVVVPHQVEEGLGDVADLARPTSRECLGE